jgi:hypothetical protein
MVGERNIWVRGGIGTGDSAGVGGGVMGGLVGDGASSAGTGAVDADATALTEPEAGPAVPDPPEHAATRTRTTVLRTTPDRALAVMDRRRRR